MVSNSRLSPSCLTVIGVYRYVCKIIVLKAHWVCKKVYHLCTLALNAIFINTAENPEIDLACTSELQY